MLNSKTDHKGFHHSVLGMHSEKRPCTVNLFLHSKGRALAGFQTLSNELAKLVFY